MNNIQSNRIHYVDVAKGFLISLVVLGHCAAYSLGDHSRLFYFIYAFHMPCWFFLSGIFYKVKHSDLYFSSKLKTLLLPYIIFSVFNVFFAVVSTSLSKDVIYKTFSFGGLWFLITLFLITVIYFVIDNACLKNISKSVRCVIHSIISLTFLSAGLLAGGGKTGTYDIFIVTLVNYFFYHIGVCIGEYKESYSTSIKSKRFQFLIIGVVLLALLFYVAPFNPSPVDVRINRYGSKLMFVGFSIIGIAGTLFLSAGIQKGKFIEYLGRNSLTILLFHIPVWRVISLVCNLMNITGYVRLSLSFIISMIVSLVAVRIVNNYIPQLKGEFHYLNE